MTIEYKDSKRIVTSATSATSVQGYSTLSAGTNGWGIGTGSADGTLLSLQVDSGSALIGDPIQNIKVTIYKNLSPDQLVYVRVRNSSDTILAEASKQASTLAGSATEYVFTFNTAVILSALDRVNVEYYGANGTGTVGIEVLNNAGTSTVNCQRDTATAGVYTDIARRPSWQFDSSPSTTISILQDKPTDVQDNSILIEKDTAKRYWASVIGNTGLKAYYKFNASSGNIENKSTSSDSIGSSGDMTITGATYSQTGIIGNALSFDGSNDYGNMATSPLTGIGINGDFTIVMWVKTDNFDGTGAPAILGSYNSTSGSGTHWQFYHSSTEVRFSDGSTTVGWTITNEENNAWHMMVLNRTGSSIKYWFDNSDKGALTAGFALNHPSTYLKLAQRGDETSYSDIEVDEMSMWDRALTDAEMTSLYNAGSGQAVGATWTRQIPFFTSSFWAAGGTASAWTAGNFHDEFSEVSWSTASALSTSVSLTAGAGTRTDGSIFGGDTGGWSSPSAVTQEWNGSSWGAGDVLSTARHGLTGGGSGTSAMLAVAGYNGSNLSSTEEYNGTAWSAGGAISTARRTAAGGGIISNFWIAGGEPSNLSSTEEYNGTSWSAGANLTVGLSGLTSAGAGQTDEGWFTGGYNGSANTDDMHLYNGTAWSAGGLLSNNHKYVYNGGSQSNAIAAMGRDSSWAVTWAELYNGTAWSTTGSVSSGRSTGAGGN